jgi:hypothetical protein
MRANFAGFALWYLLAVLAPTVLWAWIAAKWDVPILAFLLIAIAIAMLSFFPPDRCKLWLPAKAEIDRMARGAK